MGARALKLRPRKFSGQVGIKLAAFADAGFAVELQRPTSWDVTGETLQVGLDSPSMVCAPLCARSALGFPVGTMRLDLAYPLNEPRHHPRRAGVKCATARKCSVSVGASNAFPFAAVRSQVQGIGPRYMSEPEPSVHSPGLTLEEIVGIDRRNGTGAKPAFSPDRQRCPSLSGWRPATSPSLTTTGSVRAAGNPPAGACLTTAALAKELPARVAALTVREPYRAFVTVAQKRISAGREKKLAVRRLKMTARLEDDVTVEPGAVVGRCVEIGAGSDHRRQCGDGDNVRIGRGGSIGAATV